MIDLVMLDMSRYFWFKSVDSCSSRLKILNELRCEMHCIDILYVLGIRYYVIGRNNVSFFLPYSRQVTRWIHHVW